MSIFCFTNEMKTIAAAKSNVYSPEKASSKMSSNDIEMQQATTRRVSGGDNLELKFNNLELSENEVEIVNCGSFDCKVVVHGKRSKTAIITLHDIGLNSQSNFGAFFKHSDACRFVDHFCIYHINLPGQSSCDSEIEDFPTMESLSDCFDRVAEYFDIKHFIGMAAGAGAFALMSFAMKKPNMLDGIILINPVARCESWANWMHVKVFVNSTSGDKLSNQAKDYLMWYHLGNYDYQSDIYNEYQQSLEMIKPRNILKFLEQYNARKQLNLERPGVLSEGLHPNAFNCPSLILCGRRNPRIEECRHIFSVSDPRCTSIIEINNCADVLNEKPLKVFNSMVLFLQGLGYPLTRIKDHNDTFHSEY